MICLVKIELYKIFRKWRTYIGFLAIVVLVTIIQIAMHIEGQRSINFMTHNLQQSFLLVGNLLNGYLVSHLILNSLVIHIPFLITLVAGDLLAGEATSGTYRMLITRPVSRFNIVTSKFIAGIIYTIMIILFLAIFSLGLGLSFFGSGDLLVVQNGTIIVFSKNDILWRFLLAYSFSSLAMVVVASLAFLFSSLVENAIGPIISTMTIIIIFMIISGIDVSIFSDIKPYLFTNYMNGWRLFFDDPINVREIIKDSLVLLVHIFVFFGSAAIIFQKKDILS
ncbi:MAG TPA: ABC transporter permease subunit [Ignavibacteriaceae bacterium]|nr:ABC transporter permease subunit [Ignavibacteriaceae bacterium]